MLSIINNSAARRCAYSRGCLLTLALFLFEAPLMVATATAADLADSDTVPMDRNAPAAENVQRPYNGIEEVMVTARKREETSQDVPLSVVAISPEQIQKYDLTSLERVAAQTPSFVIGRAPSGSGATLVLRGIGSNSTSIGLEQSVAVVVDDVYYGQGRVINEGFFDLARLEILKGPQALFFGKNATAGVVSITTADPGNEFEMTARVGYEFKAKQVLGESAISVPVSDKLAVRFAVRGSIMNDGYFSNIGETQTYPTRDRVSAATVVSPTNHVSGVAGDGRAKEIYFRPTIKWTPTDRLTATLKGSFANDDNDNPAASSVIYNCPTGATSFNPAIKCARKFASSSNLFPLDIAAVMPYARPGGLLGDSYTSWAITGNVAYDAENITYTWVTNYNWNRNIFRFDADSVSSSGPQGVFATEWSTFGAFSTEFRALTHYDGPANLMVGGYYQRTKRDYLAWTASGGLENTLAPQPFQRYLANSKDSKTNGETLAAFAQLTYKPVEKVEITAGVRYTHETKDSYFVQPYSHPIRVTQGVFLPNVRITANQDFDNWSPEATISFKPTSDINFYADYKTAYKSGGFSNSGILSPSASVNDFAFNPETASGFEAGVKTTLLDRQLRLNVGAYDYKYKNLQIDFFNSPVFAFSTINIGSATTKGIELELQYAPEALEGFNLHSTVNYNKARYGNSPTAPCYTGMSISDGCTIAGPGARPEQNLLGKPTANAPLWTASLGASYETPISDKLVFGISVDARYSSDYIPTAFGNPNTRQPSYVNLDASLRIKTDDERWEFAVIGKNLTNNFVVTGGADAPNTGSGTGTAHTVLADQTGFVSLPRTVEVQVTWHY